MTRDAVGPIRKLSPSAFLSEVRMTSEVGKATSDMRVSVFTQDERVYLPLAISKVLADPDIDVSCVVLSSPMSTHGGVLAGLRKHLPVFGVLGTIIMVRRLLWSKVAPTVGIKPRKSKFWSIADLARAHGVPVCRVCDVNSREMHDVIEAHKADLLVSVSCPQIIRAPVLAKFPRGGINVHSAPLPRYRGLMPGFWVLYHGERETAVTVHELAQRLDDGDIIHQETVPIDEHETWDSLIRKTKDAAGSALVHAIHAISEGREQRRVNDDALATQFSFPTASDALEFRRRGKRMF